MAVEKKTAPVAEEQVKAPDGSITIPLTKKVKVDGDEVSKLVFREPTGGDIERFGNPVILDMSSDPIKVTFDEKKMLQMMAGLANVPPSSIRMLSPRDWNTIAWALAGNFIPDLSL